MQRARKAAIILAIAASTTLATPALAAQTKPGRAQQLPPSPKVDVSGPVVLRPSVPAKVKVDMRKLPVARRSGEQHEVPLGQLGPARPAPERRPSVAGTRRAAPAQPAPVFGTVGANFDAITRTNSVPPDTVMDVGPNHIVEMVNSVFQIFDKNGTSLVGPSAINSLWTAAGLTNTCATRNDGDPVVVYDHLADRWLLSQFAIPSGFNTPPTFECVAVSQTANPTAGTWFLYQFQFNNAFDYPKLGLWPTGYFMSSQRGFPSNNTTPSLDAYALDRATMLTGGAVAPIQFTINGPSLILLPSDLDGPAPPAGTPAFFARHVDGNQWGGTDRIDLFSFTPNYTTPANSTFTALPSLNTAAFDSNLCNTGNLFDSCVPQSGTTQLLETLPHWAMYSLQFRSFGGVERMVFNHTVDADGTGHAAPMWHEVRRTAGGAWTLFQEGVFAPDTGNPGLADDLHRWMGSVAQDDQGNIALGYSTSSSTTFPSVMAAGRLASDPLGQLPNGEVNIVTGGGVQPSSVRWGDYSAMRVDPVDGCTFWYGQEYIPSTVPGISNWRTRIAALRFSSCIPQISIDDVAQQEGDTGATAFTFTVSLSRASAFPTTVDFATADGTATVANNDYQPTAGTLTFSPGETTKTVTVLVNGDAPVEPDETFFVNLSNATNGTIIDSQGQGTILNDDVARISINDVADDEGNAGLTPFTFTVSLSTFSFQTITVQYATADGSATAPSDYTATSGTLSFNPGETSKTVTVPVHGDTVIEPDETFTVNLSSPTNAVLLDAQGEGTIRNDDLNPNAACTITGTNGNDTIVGTSGNDVICGRNGNDQLAGMGGNDVLIGGNGRDRLTGGDGNDLLLGDNGDDTLQGGPGNDTLRGGRGDDTLTGGTGSDALFGFLGDDSLNTQDGVPANDSGDGGPGTDSCVFDPGDFISNCP
jgi:Ca2+-binding RTX toxin-like protein